MQPFYSCLSLQRNAKYCKQLKIISLSGYVMTRETKSIERNPASEAKGRRWLPSGLQRRVYWYEFTKVS
jgi:hypothetical protein